MADTPPILVRKVFGSLRPANAASEEALRAYSDADTLRIRELRLLVQYDPTSGDLFWRTRSSDMFPGKSVAGRDGECSAWNKRYAGKPALNYLNRSGYAVGSILGKSYRSHRVCWAIHHGYWPSEIDHIDGNRSNNRISNLREVTRKQNSCNRKRRSDNTSGATGVRFSRGTWKVRIHRNGRECHVGSFKSKEEAIAAWRKAASLLEYHPNHGRSEA